MHTWGWVLLGWAAVSVVLACVMAAVVRLREERDPRPGEVRMPDAWARTRVRVRRLVSRR